MISCSCRNKHALSVSWSAAAVETNMLCVSWSVAAAEQTWFICHDSESSFLHHSSQEFQAPPVFIIFKLVECLSKSVYMCLSSMTNSKECLGPFLILEVILWLAKNHSREYATLILQLTFCPWDEASSFSIKEADLCLYLCLCASSLFLPVCKSTKSVYTVQTHTHVCTYSSLFDLTESCKMEISENYSWSVTATANIPKTGEWMNPAKNMYDLQWWNARLVILSGTTMRARNKKDLESR